MSETTREREILNEGIAIGEAQTEERVRNNLSKFLQCNGYSDSKISDFAKIILSKSEFELREEDFAESESIGEVVSQANTNERVINYLAKYLERQGWPYEKIYDFAEGARSELDSRVRSIFEMMRERELIGEGRAKRRAELVKNIHSHFKQQGWSEEKISNFTEGLLDHLDKR